MTGRLFWKIFSAFLLTFVAMLIAMWAVFAFILPTRPALDRWSAELAAPDVVQMAVYTVHKGGVATLDPTMMGGALARLRVERVASASATPHDPRPDPDARYRALARAPNGTLYRVSYRMPPPVPRRGGLAPPEVYGVGLVAGLIFALGLAFYLSRPIRRLRAAFEAFAQGDLSVRLGPQMGRRRDEIADLAYDFDGMADRIEQLVQARDQLIHDVSHELRSPLARLHLAIGLSRQNSDRTALAFDRIEREARRLDEMVGELLTLSRLESEVGSIEGYFDLPDLIRDVVSDAAFEGGLNTVAVDAILPPDQSENGRCDIAGDAELMRRALENILRNAIRYAPADSRVTVSLADEATRATVTIEDEGPGVAEQDLASLFEPFRSGPGGGFGLGLTIARRAVHAHRGTIAVFNREMGGLGVTISLPKAASAPAG